MVETEMQKFARSIDDGEFEMATFFKEAFINGQLQSTDVAAKHLRRIIDGRYKNGEIVNFGI